MKDLFKECYDERASATEFKQVFCARCRNPTCSLAGWGKDKFGVRVMTQEERLFNPTFADPNNPKYASLQKRDFPTLFREAIRLERADAIGDWSLPEENVVLAPIEPESATDTSQDLVEEAVRSLRREGSTDQPADQSEAAESAPETPEHQSSGSTSSETEKEEAQNKLFAAKNPTPKSKENTTKVDAGVETPRRTTNATGEKNTAFDDGQMLGGDYPRQELDGPKSKKKRVLDPWGSSDKVHEPGTTVKMGKDK